jgi:hypothetical protein
LRDIADAERIKLHPPIEGVDLLLKKRSAPSSNSSPFTK